MAYEIKSRIKETPENRTMQEQIRRRANQSLAILAEPLLKRRHEQAGEESMWRLANYLTGCKEYSL